MPLTTPIREALRRIDEACLRHLPTLKAKDVYSGYTAFFDELKVLQGSARGFTGLSELLVFRLLVHSLSQRGCRFERTPATGEIHSFSCVDHCQRVLCTQAPVQIGGKRLSVDVAAYRSPSRIASIDGFARLAATHGALEHVIEIKLWFNEGVRGALATTARLASIEASALAAPSFTASVAHLGPPKPAEREHLHQFAERNAWFAWASFAGNDEDLTSTLDRLTTRGPAGTAP